MSSHRFEVRLAWMAACAVLATAAFRMALVIYLEAAARRGLQAPLPSVLDALLYAAMCGAMIAGTRWESWRSKIGQVSPAAS